MECVTDIVKQELKYFVLPKKQNKIQTHSDYNAKNLINLSCPNKSIIYLYVTMVS